MTACHSKHDIKKVVIVNKYMTSLFKLAFNQVKNYCLGISDTTDIPELELPKFPHVMILFVFILMGSKILGNSISIVLMTLIVLLDTKWWLSCFFNSAIVRHPLRWLYVVIIAFMALSVITSQNFSLSMYRFVSALAISWIAIGAFEILSRTDYKKWLPWLIIIFSTYIIILIIVITSETLLKSLYLQVIYTCWIFVCIIPILIYSLGEKTVKVLYKSAVILIIISIAIISYKIENRSTMVSYFAIFATLIVIKYIKFGWKLLPVLMTMFAGVFLLVTIGYSYKYRLFSGAQGELFAPTWIIDPVRQAIWQFAWNSIPSTPTFGFGINASNRIEGALDQISWLSEPPLNLNMAFMYHTPHNVFLQWLLELGWITFILIVIFYLLLLVKLILDKNEVQKYELLIHAGYFGIGLVNGNFWSPFWLIAYVFSLAIIKALCVSKRVFK